MHIMTGFFVLFGNDGHRSFDFVFAAVCTAGTRELADCLKLTGQLSFSLKRTYICSVPLLHSLDLMPHALAVRRLPLRTCDGQEVARFRAPAIYCVRRSLGFENSSRPQVNILPT